MKNIGIIAEFNPFHNGHKYLIDSVKEKYNPDCIIVIMSGNYVQRGDLAIIDKWRRAKTAINNGVNLVVELPVPYAIQNAEMFSKGSLGILSKLNIDYISFGTETDSLNKLVEIAEKLSFESVHFKMHLKKFLSEGYSYPKSLALTLHNDDYQNILTPNNILAIEYIKTIIKNDYHIQPLNIIRKGSSYSSTIMNENFSSASAIRKELYNSNFENTRNNVPYDSLYEINEFHAKYKTFNLLNNMYKLIQYRIISMNKSSLSKIYDMTEGIENKIIKNIGLHNNLNDFILSVKSKRYTYSRISRILLNILLNINSLYYEDLLIEEINNVKVLSFDEKGQQFLKENKKHLKFITKKSEFNYHQASTTDRKIFDLTNYSSKLYYLSLNSNNINNESLHNSIRIKKDGL